MITVMIYRDQMEVSHFKARNMVNAMKRLRQFAGQPGDRARMLSPGRDGVRLITTDYLYRGMGTGAGSWHHERTTLGA